MLTAKNEKKKPEASFAKYKLENNKLFFIFAKIEKESAS